MAVKNRLIRMGKKKSPVYRVVVVDGRSPRDGRYIEQIGRYDPRQEPSLIEIDNDKANEWLAKGAQPTEAVEKLLNISGAISTKKVKQRQIHVVPAAAQGQDEEPEGAPLAPTHEEAAAAAQSSAVDEPPAVEAAEESPAAEAAEESPAVEAAEESPAVETADVSSEEE
jgi:small subunit ribosomal protein S16